MSKPSAQGQPAGSHPPAGDGSASQTRAVAVTLAVLAVWATLTLAAPWLAQPVSDVVQLVWYLLGIGVPVAETP